MTVPVVPPLEPPPPPPEWPPLPADACLYLKGWLNARGGDGQPMLRLAAPCELGPSVLLKVRLGQLGECKSSSNSRCAKVGKVLCCFADASSQAA